jgi:hypothetical protein
MKKLHISSYLIALSIISTNCGNDEGDPSPIDCSLSPIVMQIDATLENCGLSDGIVAIVATGGNGSLSYSIDNGATFQSSATFGNLTSGNYEIVARDANDCENNLSFTLDNTGGITISIDQTVNSTCDTSVGEIIASSSGGSNVQFKLGGGNLQNSGTFSGLSAGKYTVHAIEDGTGCETTEDVTILSDVSFAASIQNIITTECAISGCHVSGTGRQDLTNLSTIQSNAADIRARTQSGNMPRNGTLTANQIQLIACWVDDGALNN